MQLQQTSQYKNHQLQYIQDRLVKNILMDYLVNVIALSMDINTNYVNTDDDSSYMFNLHQFSTNYQTIKGKIEVNENMQYPYNYNATCEYITPII